VIGTTRQVSVFAFDAPVDMRRGFDGLFSLVGEQMKRDPLCGDLFLFVSRNRRRAKVLYWDGTGLCVFAKRLEKGKFVAPWKRDSASGPLKLTTSELALLLEGSELVGKVALSPAEFSLPMNSARRSG
jgi:transposase